MQDIKSRKSNLSHVFQGGAVSHKNCFNHIVLRNQVLKLMTPGVQGTQNQPNSFPFLHSAIPRETSLTSQLDRDEWAKQTRFNNGTCSNRNVFLKKTWRERKNPHTSPYTYQEHSRYQPAGKPSLMHCSLGTRCSFHSIKPQIHITSTVPASWMKKLKISGNKIQTIMEAEIC